MKKITLLGLFLSCFIFAGCSYKFGENESYYEGELVVAGVGPEISFEPTVEEGTLVLKKTFEDHSDHLFLDNSLFFEMKDKYIKCVLWCEFRDPGSVVKFKGIVESIDGAAGNHYYNVKSIDKLELVRRAEADEIKEIFESYNYCESDDDCEYFMGECPLGCYIPMNKKYINEARNIISSFKFHQKERCVYGCLDMNKAVCRNYKCEMINSESEENTGSIACTPEEKVAENCNMIYQPVCGSDSRTYGNSCVACQSETVESYAIGECESSAFTVEGDSEYLQEVEEILAKNGAVTCDLFYTDYDRQVHSFFMVDENRFYSAVDDYSDNLQRNVFYTLAVDGKVYNWSTFSGSEKTVINSPADIKSEIASLLMDKSEYSDFEMNCYEGIDVTNEHLFGILSE